MDESPNPFFFMKNSSKLNTNLKLKMGKKINLEFIFFKSN